MLSGPFLSSFVFLLSKHRSHFTHRLLRCAWNAERAYHLSVVYGYKVSSANSLALASEKGYLRTVIFLVRSGADVHALRDDALRCASRNGHLDVVKYLVGVGADVRAFNNYALRCASKYGHSGVAKFLVINGANTNTKHDRALRRGPGNGRLSVTKLPSLYPME
jgi:ankyrin repeat protein